MITHRAKNKSVLKNKTELIITSSLSSITGCWGEKRGTVKAICGQSINSLVSICYNTGVTQTGIVSQWFARHLNFKSKYCKSDTTSPPFKTKSQLPRPPDRADSDVSKKISQIQ